MKMVLKEDPACRETEVFIRCQQATAEIQRILDMFRVLDRKLVGQTNGESILLEVGQLLYAESVDKRTYLYTQDGVYESGLRLYELEDALGVMDFFRVTKSSIVNFARIRAIRPELGGRLLVTMENGEKLWVSRQYAGAIREKLKELGAKVS